MTRFIGMAILLTSVGGTAFAGLSTPEIDGASGMVAIGLLVGGLLVLRSRRKKN
jgi:LPXTG-motif cell wall-anchored protein